MVGRDTDLARLDGLFEMAIGGRRQLVFVTGEAGIGKTTLVEAFLARLGTGGGLRIGRGQCVEQYGTMGRKRRRVFAACAVTVHARGEVSRQAARVLEKLRSFSGESQGLPPRTLGRLRPSRPFPATSPKCEKMVGSVRTEGDMEFGVFVATKIDDWQLIQYAEQLGYDRAWIPDSQMIWSDCYATLALAAHNTPRIKLGTGVAIPGTRIAPVTAHSIASINRIAPGRVFLGIGTGHTAMRCMGMNPMKIRDFREYLRVVRALLRGEEVEYTLNGVTRAIRFFHLDLGFIDLE